MPYSTSDWYMMGSWFCEGLAVLILLAGIVHLVTRRFRNKHEN